MERPSAPVPTNVITPAANSASGTLMRSHPSSRHASTPPIGASTATGGRTVAPTNDTNDPGTCWSPRTRPRSSASSEVACRECSGSPVTIQSLSAQKSGAKRTATVAARGGRARGARRRDQPGGADADAAVGGGAARGDRTAAVGGEAARGDRTAAAGGEGACGDRTAPAAGDADAAAGGEAA